MRQLLAIAWMQVRLWLRLPKHILVSIALSIAFLVIANRVMVIRLGRHMSVGVHTMNPEAARLAEREFGVFNITMLRYDRLEDGRRDLANDRIVGLMSLPTEEQRSVHLVFSGRNPLVDRELASVLLRVASQISTNAAHRTRITMENNRYTPDVMTTFMTSGLLPFLIFALASVNLGLFWLCDYEKGTLYTLLAAPARRSVLVAGRTLGALAVILVTFIAAVALCRRFVHWDMGGQPVAWWAAAVLQMVTMGGVFFALAMVCRRFALYSDVSMILVLVLVFLSGALTPIQTMPGWARILGALTPTYYAVRMMRAVMTGADTALPRDVLALVLWAAAGYAFGYWRLRAATLDRRG
ncbi:ABC transporter permease [bacterium]|nr:ABC transporter permease [bacterium]